MAIVFQASQLAQIICRSFTGLYRSRCGYNIRLTTATWILFDHKSHGNYLQMESIVPGQFLTNMLAFNDGLDYFLRFLPRYTLREGIAYLFAREVEDIYSFNGLIHANLLQGSALLHLLKRYKDLSSENTTERDAHINIASRSFIQSHRKTIEEAFCKHWTSCLPVFALLRNVSDWAVNGTSLYTDKAWSG